jgi:tRNA pseudouridine55 synthase
MAQYSDISGMIPLIKPAGMTSKDISRALLRRFGQLKLGHVGTLDPEADGVLPVLVGRATKLQDYLLDLDKAYSFDLTLGKETTTLDASGETVREMAWPQIECEELRQVLSQFTGCIEQVPPLYSAVKLQGQELYKFAHRGHKADDLPLESLKRRVLIKAIVIDKLQLPVISLSVSCGKGTYIRTLAFDIAKNLGTVGYVTRLQRTHSAGLNVANCITLDQALSPQTTLESIVISIDQLAIGLPAWAPNDRVLIQRIIDGQRIIQMNLPSDILKTSPSFEILLKNSDQKSVGIVRVEPLTDGSYKLHMKRGL